MAQLTAAFLQQIRYALMSYGRTQEVDWDVKVEDGDGHESKLSIRYAYSARYVFQAVVSTRGTVTIQASMRPGEMQLTETASFKASDDFLSAVTEWAQRVQKELAAEPLARRVEEQQREIADLMAKYGKVEDLVGKMFTKEEATALIARLDALEAKLAEEIAEAETNEKKRSAEIDALQREIADLKRMATSADKAGWLRKWGTWVVTKAAANQTVQKALAQATDAATTEVLHRLLGP